MNDGLTPREHSEMKDLVLAGSQRIRPVGRHRAQFIAGALALVLVGGVTGGAIATAALLGSEAQPAPAMTTTEPAPVPAPEPTPTESIVPTPAPQPQAATPFGGACSNALGDDAVEAVAGIDMVLSDYRWRTGANDVLGGIDCVWVSDGVYLAATVHLFAYPESIVAESVIDGAVAGCVSQEGADTHVECSYSRVVDGTWMLVRAVGDPQSVSAPGVEGLFDDAANALSSHPAGHPLTRTSEWWALPECERLVDQIDPALYGFERVALLPDQSTEWYTTDRPEGIALFAGATTWCDLHFTSGTGDDTSGETVRVDVVPGGGVTFETARNAEHAQSVVVDGAQAAVVVPGLDRYEGSGAVIVATDGENVLMVTPDWVRDTTDAVPLASALFGFMGS